MPRPYVHRPLAQAARRAGLSRADLASELGVSLTTLSYWSAQYTAIPRKHVGRLAELLRLGPAEVEEMSRPREGVTNNIAAVMEERGLGLAELAALTGYTRKKLQPMVAGVTWVPPHVARALEEALGMPAEYLTAPSGGDR
ncbi:helix-turn-helix transcriptional regulator [Nocardioides sp.]|uniref:helix-turn-helix transcriptional regulator n=1 Tax=Nocardioides sp. TaxID=35761 RepID=UPI0026283847|nr:helix-turn-helix transcriptional regulator [Nocardioides sp.]MCW2735448.1 hypothetical protein [Nocardioides sp.]